MFNIYYYEETLSKKDLLILVLLVLGNVCANEMLNIAFCVLMIILFIRNLLYKFIKKQTYNNKYILISLLSAAIFSVGINLLSKLGITDDLWKSFGLSLNFLPSFDTIKHFIILFIKYSIIKNIYLWIIYFLCIISVYMNGKDKAKNIKIIEYVVYSNIGFLSFMIGTIFLPGNCYLVDFQNYSFWFLHSGLIFTFDISLFLLIIFMIGYLKYNSKNEKAYLIIVSLIICSGILFMYSQFKNMQAEIPYKKVKLRAYKNDKMSIFYLKHGKTIILPKEQYIFFTNETPERLSANSELYTKTYHRDESSYLIYLEKSYNLDTTPGLTFKPEAEAIQECIDNGGDYALEDIDKLKFKDLKKLAELKE
ncbi:hypothetical protein IJ182_01515 [bacterium]|nr:hypothetical protein [bacterium]